MTDSFRQRGGGWAVAQLAIMVAIAVLGLAFPADSRSPVLRVLSWVLFAAGVTFALPGVWSLGRNLTIYPRLPRGGRLVRGGVYRLVRHPLYTGVLLSALGWGLLRQSWPALAGAIVLALFLDAKARREERWLLERFPEYGEYQRRVRRFIPGLY